MSKKKLILITLLIAIPIIVIALLGLSVLWLLLGIETSVAIRVLASLVLLLSVLQQECCQIPELCFREGNGACPSDGGCPYPSDGCCPTDGTGTCVS